MARAHFDVDAHDGFAYVPSSIEAGIAQVQAQLIFALGVKTAVAFVTGRVVWVLLLFAYMYLRMDFQFNHCSPLP